MRFSFAFVLSIFVLITSAAAIPVSDDGQLGSSISRRDFSDDTHELYARAKKRTPTPRHHPQAYGKVKPPPPKLNKQERKAQHLKQQAKATKRRQESFQNRQKSMAKHGKKYTGPVQSKEAALKAKQQRVQAKAKSTQQKAKADLAKNNAARKANDRAFFGKTLEKYRATKNLPNRKTVYTTPGNKKFTGADARRAVFNAHHFSANPVNNKPAPFRNAGGSSSKPHRIIPSMKGVGTEFPLSKNKHGYQGRLIPGKKKGQNPSVENPGPARAIISERKKGGYRFQGVVSHDESKKGQKAAGGEQAHHWIRGQKVKQPRPQPKPKVEGPDTESMRRLFGKPLKRT